MEKKNRFLKNFYIYIFISFLEIIFSCCLLFLPYKSVFALETNYPPINQIFIPSNASPIDFAVYFFNLGIFLGITLAVLVIIYGGILYIVSMIKGEVLEKGKEWIMGGIKGLLLLLCVYLIVYTINPELIRFNLPLIDRFLLAPNKLIITPQADVSVNYYTEIPLGVLIEKTISRKIACYDFDYKGDPIEGEEIKIENKKGQRIQIKGPTFLENDISDCLLKIANAIERKGYMSNQTSLKIAELMEKCSCDTYCETNWLVKCPSFPPCNGKGICKTKQNSNLKKSSQYACPLDKDGKEIIEKIEHGPIEVQLSTTNSEDEEALRQCINTYKGLDEFRCPNPDKEAPIKECESLTEEGKEILQLVKVIENDTLKINEAERKKEKKIYIIDKEKWNKLNLIQQLIFLRELYFHFQSIVEADERNLVRAREEIGKCYTVKSAVEFLRMKEKTSPKKDREDVQPFYLFYAISEDSLEREAVERSKYCKGFEYGQSTCYYFCGKICPGDSPQDFNNYKQCPNCENIEEQEQRKKCLEEQKNCMKERFKERKCPNSPFKNFSECLEGCKNQCLEKCKNLYEKDKCSDKSEECQKLCEEDSKCLLDNEEKCIMNFNNLYKCPFAYSRTDLLKSCYNLSFLCKYGSDQHGGYPSCLKKQYLIKDPITQNINENLAEIEYSASFLFKNRDSHYECCEKPYEPLSKDNYCGSPPSQQDSENNQSEKESGWCVRVYPETAKCPNTSYCPQCPCGIINIEVEKEEEEEDGGDENTEEEKETIEEYQVVTSKCDEYGYDGDPLTFYCRTAYRPETPLIGKWDIMPKDKEIPVGETTDESIAWVRKFLEFSNNFLKEINEMTEYLKRIGEEKDYCKCESKCTKNETACQIECKTKTIITKDPGTGKDIIEKTCEEVPCHGNPCQKMINLLLGKEKGNELTNNKKDACPKETTEGFEGVEWYYNKVKNTFKELLRFLIKEKRSDIFKKLIYSREKMNECSSSLLEHGEEAIKVLSCTRAYLEGFLSERCYGQEEAKVRNIFKGYYGFNEDQELTDNWFCGMWSRVR